MGGSVVTLSVNDVLLIRESLKEELEAINDYTERASKCDNQLVKKLFLDIAREEKVHFGEFEELLEMVDTEHEPAEEEGEEELEDL